VKKKSKRNETMDTWVYAIAASHHPELHLHKWKAADWTRRALMVEPPNVDPGDPAADIAAAEPSPDNSPPSPAATPAPAAARKRRVIQRPPAFPTR
jgi:phage terminase large subunit GpA-like protein